MADELDAHLSEDEDLERAKRFWKENGRSITAGVLLGLAGIAGYNGWQAWQKSEGENASMLFDNLRDPALPASSASTVAADLMDDYGGTPYAANGALLMAKREAEAGNFAEAGRYLEFVIDSGKDDGIRHIARIRLALVRLADNKPDEALIALDPVGRGDTGEEFASRYYELAGDAYAMIGDNEKARAAWLRSQETLPPSSGNAGVLKMKIDNLGNF